MTANIESLVKTLSDRISGTGEVIVTAESLTGGMISAALTSVSGSSAWFERGFVTYTNEAKHQMLDVPQGILDRFTAVSAETVTHMLIGALKHSGASVAVAVSGIAGPTAHCPVSLSVLCLSDGGGEMRLPKLCAASLTVIVLQFASKPWKKR